MAVSAGLPDLTSLVLFSLAIVTSVLIFQIQSRKRQQYPPGPKGLPVLGNALDIPTEQPWVKYVEWGKQFGDVVYLSALGQPLVILNSAKAVFDLLDRKSANYSDRPHAVMCGELAGYADCPPLCAYGPQHREYRRLLSEILVPRRLESWRPVEEDHIHEFVSHLMRTPDRFLEHVRRTVASIVFEISHGHVVAEKDDPLLKVAEQGDLEFAEMLVPGAFLVDSFPILRHIPEWTGVSFKKKAREYRKTMELMRDLPYNLVKDQASKGIARPSFTLSLIERREKPTPEEEYTYKWTSTGLYSAGADTSVSVISSFFLAMAQHPEIQRKAQEELDQVVGNTRFPSFHDRPNLPYINCIVKEVYRLNPVAPLAIPHRAMEEDVYRDWKIPKGTVLIPNTWGILHDPELYPSPHEFNPERYMDAESKSGSQPRDKTVNPDPSKYLFGYGRRVCPGQALADDTVFLAIATTLSVINIGTLTSPVPKYSSSIISHPESFKCPITPRSAQAVELVTRNR